MITSLTIRQATIPGVTIWYLITVSRVRKFLGPLDPGPTRPQHRLAFQKGKLMNDKTWVVYNKGAQGRAQLAFQAHQTQYRWYRTLYLFWSRYMTTNELECESMNRDSVPGLEVNLANGLNHAIHPMGSLRERLGGK
jgi:hypothetical protein